MHKLPLPLLAFGLFLGLAAPKLPADSPSIGSGISIPEIATDYVLIYKPQSDVYSLKDTKHYKSGEIYHQWQPNDHTFAIGPNGRWHCIGLTRPDDIAQGEMHEAGGLTFHALAPVGTLEDAFRPSTWIDQPKFRSAGTGGAPYSVKIGKTYHLINSSNGHGTSTDLYNWKDNGYLQLKKDEETRDPNVLFWNGTYYLVRCNDRTVNLSTSTDFVNWTDPVDIFEAPVESWQCESPILLHRDGRFYLFWCLWDSSPYRDKLLALYEGHLPWAYDYRTFVYVSDKPTDFKNREPIAQLKAHAPEIFQDETGNYFISSADYPQRGINLARLTWKTQEP